MLPSQIMSELNILITVKRDSTKGHLDPRLFAIRYICVNLIHIDYICISRVHNE